jgi:hypothetical protein
MLCRTGLVLLLVQLRLLWWPLAWVPFGAGCLVPLELRLAGLRQRPCGVLLLLCLCVLLALLLLCLLGGLVLRLGLRLVLAFLLRWLLLYPVLVRLSEARSHAGLWRLFFLLLLQLPLLLLVLLCLLRAPLLVLLGQVVPHLQSWLLCCFFPRQGSLLCFGLLHLNLAA